METFLNNLIANKDAIAVIKDLVTIFATVSAAIVAILGLQTWKRQIRGNAEYDLARRVSIGVYRLQVAMFESWWIVRVYGINKTESENKEIFEEGLKFLTEVVQKLVIDFLEAQAVWGDEQDFMESIEEFFRLEKILEKSFDPRIRFTIHDDKTAEDMRKLTEGNYYQEVEQTVKKIEKFLRLKLLQKHGIRNSQQWKTFKQWVIVQRWRAKKLKEHSRIRWQSRIRRQWKIFRKKLKS